ncbi:gibberellin 2-beta-dioxygenase [Brachypodium distachyon]|uniref:Fe2OG dioxygenase domain-containing protein n=1 Tax=Brachypodium distachyon TaxID=15368 RepID=I1HGH4_BRADI|nr:gibberellin 2-beta-dioxygenase [Brachypodium distachyon]KQK04914.1 hypothetical protein BRADI_2g16750v3 [Brachypodium distachyon]|eukprot:XP_003565924.1 gibberellin 2-beta-dioxygenase [Brachypodium distachyon]
MVAIKAPSSIDHANPLTKSPKAAAAAAAAIPTVDLSSPGAARAVADACRGVGFFRATNHGIPSSLAAALEARAMAFFALPHEDKVDATIAAAARRPFGYGSRSIGSNGDVGWLEYLLLSLGSNSNSSSIPGASSLPPSLRAALEEYTGAVRNASGKVLELMAEGLGMQERCALRRMVDGSEEELVRVNHYPPTKEEDCVAGMTGFGEHTDPQIISLLRSNRTAGLQIKLQGPDAPWVNVAPDPDSLFVNVGDCLQVLTNGRFRSVKHRVVAPEGAQASRLSVIYFGGPAPAQRIAPLPELMREGEQSLYRDFTWGEYKAAAYKTRLGDNRLGPYELRNVADTNPTALITASKEPTAADHCCSNSSSSSAACVVVQPPHVAQVH